MQICLNVSLYMKYECSRCKYMCVVICLQFLYSVRTCLSKKTNQNKTNLAPMFLDLNSSNTETL